MVQTSDVLLPPPPPCVCTAPSTAEPQNHPASPKHRGCQKSPSYKSHPILPHPIPPSPTPPAAPGLPLIAGSLNPFLAGHGEDPASCSGNQCPREGQGITGLSFQSADATAWEHLLLPRWPVRFPSAVPTTAKDGPWLMNSPAGVGCTTANCPRESQQHPEQPPSHMAAMPVSDCHSQLPALGMVPSWLWVCTLWLVGFRECCLSPIKQCWEVLGWCHASVSPSGKWTGMMLTSLYSPSWLWGRSKHRAKKILLRFLSTVDT